MTKRLPYHRRYHQDALNGYSRLTLEQRGAYTTILDLIYDNGGPLDFRDRWLAGQFGVSIRKARVLVLELVDAGKLYLTEGGQISNARADEELAGSRKAYDAVSKAAKERESRKRAGKIVEDGQRRGGSSNGYDGAGMPPKRSAMSFDDLPSLSQEPALPVSAQLADACRFPSLLCRHDYDDVPHFPGPMVAAKKH